MWCWHNCKPLVLRCYWKWRNETNFKCDVSLKQKTEYSDGVFFYVSSEDVLSWTNEKVSFQNIWFHEQRVSRQALSLKASNMEDVMKEMSDLEHMRSSNIPLTIRSQYLKSQSTLYD